MVTRSITNRRRDAIEAKLRARRDTRFDDLVAYVAPIFEAIQRNDKTNYAYSHEIVPPSMIENRDGQVPVRGRWQTPRELAKVALAIIEEKRNGQS